MSYFFLYFDGNGQEMNTKLLNELNKTRSLCIN